VLRDTVLRRGVSTARSSRTLDAIVAEHRGVLERIEDGDAEGAAEAMRAHVQHTAADGAGERGAGRRGRSGLDPFTHAHRLTSGMSHATVR